METDDGYIIGHAAPPRFNEKASIARIDIDPAEIATACRLAESAGADFVKTSTGFSTGGATAQPREVEAEPEPGSVV